MAWIALFVAGLLEVVWAYFMKLSDGFTRPGATAATFVFMFLSFGLLAWAMKQLPLGTSYMVWTGIGAVGAFIVGVVFLGEGAGLMRIAAAGLIVAGIGLMKLATP
ncbi:multidrug efflux SMR transporter [Sphingomonas sp. AOB5]|uniref:DMT family transporter n=1 Tax=Sphingomonas sp. AOB5 TaxID=3034017 RepID=UPI0023F794A4|nr:multidrug efflux SMR transporter [Sphingomonas sp. AOB5]MDF7773924.1 multidrug efflux SMR transporter [Sphingomonas sp. AOB5]